MYPNFDGCGPALVALIVLAAVGLIAVCWGLWYVFTHLSFTWS